MEIMEIIKDAFTFPANNLKALAIYIAITFVVGIILAGGIITALFTVNSAAYMIVSLILFIIAIVIGFMLAGYEIDIIKTGIELEEIAPDFDYKNDILRGVKAVIVAIVYYIIPAIITLIVAFITNVPGNVVDVLGYVNQTAVNANGTVVSSNAVNMVPDSVAANFFGSISITILVAVVLFVIFSFLNYMANARLADTDSLSHALNIPEAFNDISRIGFGKVIATVLLVIIITVIITGVLSVLYDKVPALSIINIIVAPFLMFAQNRANGLLYSDIA